MKALVVPWRGRGGLKKIFFLSLLFCGGKNPEKFYCPHAHPPPGRARAVADARRRVITLLERRDIAWNVGRNPMVESLSRRTGWNGYAFLVHFVAVLFRRLGIMQNDDIGLGALRPFRP